MPEDLKNHGINVSISSLISIFTLAGMGWFVLQPVMVSQISTAMAADIEEAIEVKTKPIQSAFRVLLLSDMNRLKRNIAKLVYKKDNDQENYTQADAVRLTDYKIELEAYVEAYQDLK